MKIDIKNFLYFLSSLFLIILIFSLQKYDIIKDQNNMALQMLGIAILSAIVFTILAFFKKYKSIELAIHGSFILLCIALLYSGSMIDFFTFILTMKMLIDVSIQIKKRKEEEQEEKDER